MKRACACITGMHQPGIKPGSHAWEACMMPLHYVRQCGLLASICPAFPTRCVDGAMIKLAFRPGSMSAVVWWLVLRPVTRTTWVQFPAAVLCTRDPSTERPSIDGEGSRPQAIAVRPSVQSQCTVRARVTATTRASGSHRDLPGPAHGHGASACVPRVGTWTRTPRHVLG